MKHFVVTVGCEYASGGIEIGKMIAKSLGVEYYDRDLIDKVVEQIGVDRDLAGNAKKMGDYFSAKLETLPHVKEVRHQGLLVGVEFDDTISGVDVKHGCFDRHMLITAIGAHIIRMVPPLIVSEEECDKAYEIIKETVESLSK